MITIDLEKLSDFLKYNCEKEILSALAKIELENDAYTMINDKLKEYKEDKEYTVEEIKSYEIFIEHYFKNYQKLYGVLLW